MMDHPLLISSLIDYAADIHGHIEVVSHTVEGSVHRYTWAEVRERSARLAHGLAGLGIGVGDRVGTIAWNGYRHLELYYGVSGMGAICHTMNPRLHPDQLTYIINHAEDRILCVDLTFVPLIAAVADRLETVEHVVIMTGRETMPESSLSDLLCYEELLEGQPGEYEWPLLDENTGASLCYTSGTTGNPKGVLYSHRSTVLHAFAASLPDALGVKEGQAMLPVVPMFHANAWGAPYSAAILGAKLVFTGPHMDGESLTRLMRDEKVTVSTGVPTIWMGLLDYWRANDAGVPSLEVVAVGGAAPPQVHDPGLRGGVRDRVSPGLGDDGDESHRLPQRSHCRAPPGTCRGAPEYAGEAGEADLRSRLADRGRGWEGLASRRRGDR